MEQIPNDIFVSGIHPAQLEVLKAFDERTKRFFMLKWHRRARKTTLLLNILIRECVRKPKSVYAYVGPTYKQAKSIVWRDPNMLFRYLPDQNICSWEKNESELYIKFPNKSTLLIKGGDDPDTLRGIDAEGVGFDEWALMKEVIWTEIFRPIITQDPKRWAMFAYTPKGETHATWLWQKAQDWPDWYTKELKASKSGLLAQEELDKARREMPPVLYDQEFECADITDEEFTLITSRLIHSLIGVTRTRAGVRKIVSCDPDSSMNGDECVIYALENGKVIDEDVMHERDTTKIAYRVNVMANKHNTSDVIVDSIGIGKGVCDNITALAEKRLIRFDSRERASNPQRFLNKRAEAWWYVMQQMMDKKVDYPEDLLLRQDLSSVRLKPTGRRLQLEDKTMGTKPRLGHSPDRGDAFVMGIYGQQFVPEEEYESDDFVEATDLANSYTVKSVL